MKGRPGPMRRGAAAISTAAGVCVLAWGASAPAQEADDAVRGQRLFLQCQACHSLQTSASVGPTLAGVVGRKAGTVTGYAYSPALTASGLSWDDATLERWLEHPNALVPGTKMIFSGVANRADRQSIIAYLKTIPASNAK